jgi:hypothetical protein
LKKWEDVADVADSMGRYFGLRRSGEMENTVCAITFLFSYSRKHCKKQGLE